MTNNNVQRTSPKIIELLRSSFEPGQPFVVSPDVRRDLMIDGLHTHGLEFCHELAGDGLHEPENGISGTHLRFKPTQEDTRTDGHRSSKTVSVQEGREGRQKGSIWNVRPPNPREERAKAERTERTGGPSGTK